MASWKCGSCGVINFADSIACRRCGTAVSSADANQPYQPNAPATGYPSQPNPYVQPPINQSDQGYQGYHYQNPQTPAPYHNTDGPQYPPSTQNWQQQQPHQGPPQGNPPSTWGVSQQPFYQPQQSNWQPPQPPAGGYSQPYGNQAQTGQAYHPNQNYAAPQQTDYSRAPSYGAPSAGSYQPSSHWYQGGVWREGDKLVMHKMAALPDRCIKCNVPTNGSYLHRKLSWLNPLWALLILASWVIYLIVYFAIRKTAEIDMGLCEQHKASRQTGMTIGWLCAALGIGAFVFAIAAEAIGFFFIGILLLVGGLIYGSYAASVIGVSKIDDQYIWLKRVHTDYLNSFPPSGGY